MAYTISKKQIKDLNNMNVAAQKWAGVGLGTFLNDMNNGGGGGVPGDYEELKAQVNQNAEDIVALGTELETAVNDFNQSTSEINTAIDTANQAAQEAIQAAEDAGEAVTKVEQMETTISEVQDNITQLQSDVESLMGIESIDAGDAFNNEESSAAIALMSAIAYTEDSVEYNIVDTPVAENEYSTLDEVADALAKTNNFADIYINIKTDKDITVKGETKLNGYGFRNLYITFDKKTYIDSPLEIKNFNKVRIYSNFKSLYFRPYTAGVADVITIKNCHDVELDNFLITASTTDKLYHNIIVDGCNALYLNKLRLNKGDNCIKVVNTKILSCVDVQNSSSRPMAVEMAIMTKPVYDELVKIADITNYLVFNA